MSSHHRLPLVDSAVPLAESSAPDVAADLDDEATVTEGRRAASPTPAGLMQIGDLARETGKTVRAIHLYEELGLLTPAARSKGRFRLYGREALVRIRWIA